MLIKKNGYLIVTDETKITAFIVDSDMIIVRRYGVKAVINRSDIDSYVQNIFINACDYVKNFLIPGVYYLIFQDACINVFTIVKD